MLFFFLTERCAKKHISKIFLPLSASNYSVNPVSFILAEGGRAAAAGLMTGMNNFDGCSSPAGLY